MRTTRTMMSWSARWMLGCLVAAAAAACAAREPVPTPTPAEPTPQATPVQPEPGPEATPVEPEPSPPMGEEMACPFAMPGVEVAVEDVEGGVALTFTAANDEDIMALRQAGRRMAERHAQMGPREGHGRGHGAGMGPMPPAQMIAEDVEGGVRVTVLAREEPDVEALREHVRRHVDMMRGECPYREGDEEETTPVR